MLSESLDKAHVAPRASVLIVVVVHSIVECSFHKVGGTPVLEICMNRKMRMEGAGVGEVGGRE